MVASVESSLAEVIREIPGYDPYATAGDCWFDEEAARAAIDFVQSLKHVKSWFAGKGGDLIVLQPWQVAIVANLFGWKRPDGTRRYREAFIEIPRKNSKSTMCAALVLLILFIDQERGAEIYSAAAAREQAAIVFEIAKGMLQQDEELSSMAKVYQKAITREEIGSSYKAISRDAGTQHGYNTHAAIIDELHAHKNRDLIDVLQSSTGARAQPLIISITTAGFDRNSICWEKYRYACQVRDGIIEDPSFMPVIYETTEKEDWTDEAVWAKANPNLGVSVSIDFLRSEFQKASEMPAYENTFRRLYLNQWTEQDVRAISMEKWRACVPAEVEPEKWRKEAFERLRNKHCSAAIDVASTSDLTALVLLFDEEPEHWTALPFFWVPEDGMRKRSRADKVPYELWERQGFIDSTSGDQTDYEPIRAKVNELAGMFAIPEVAVDRLFQGLQLCTWLAQDNFEVVSFGQGFADMAAPVKRLLELIGEGKINHGNNPVLMWMASNAAGEFDSAANMKFSKKKSGEKIDGIVALTMALGRAMVTGDGRSIYETRGVLVFGDDD